MRRKSILILIVAAITIALCAPKTEATLPAFSQAHVRVEYLNGESIRYEYLDTLGHVKSARIIYPNGAEEDVFYWDNGVIKQRLLHFPGPATQASIERNSSYDVTGTITADHAYRQDGSIALTAQQRGDGEYEVKQFDALETLIQYQLFHSPTDDRVLVQQIWRSDGTMKSEIRETETGSLEITDYGVDGKLELHRSTMSATGQIVADTTYYPGTTTPEYVWAQDTTAAIGQYFRADGTLREDRTIDPLGELIESFYDSAGRKYMTLDYGETYTFSAGSPAEVAGGYHLQSAYQYAVIVQGKDPQLISTINFAADGKTPATEYINYDATTDSPEGIVNRYRADGTLESVENQDQNSTVDHTSAEGIRLSIPEWWLTPDQNFPATPVDLPPAQYYPDDYDH